MSYHHDHNHTTDVRAQFRAGRYPESYAALVGTIEQGSEKAITGRSGDHIQFYLSVGGGARYQVDVNTQSTDGTAINVYIADQSVNPSGTNPDEPFGAPAYGLFPAAALSYPKIGLTNKDFSPLSYYRIEGQLTSALQASSFVTVYGLTFDDGGTDGKGVHETHFTGRPDQDGALVIYSIDPASGAPVRTWFFFKFANQNIA